MQIQIHFHRFLIIFTRANILAMTVYIYIYIYIYYKRILWRKRDFHILYKKQQLAANMLQE